MAMSRRDYEAIAAAIRTIDIPLDEYWDPQTRSWVNPRETIARHVADGIEAAGNRTFDRARFIAACTGSRT